jgi:hypothetical protein
MDLRQDRRAPGEVAVASYHNHNLKQLLPVSLSAANLQQNLLFRLQGPTRTGAATAGKGAP